MTLAAFPAGVSLVASGAATPACSVSNDQLSRWLDTSDDWIRSRTGIGARRIAGPGESLAALAAAAGRQALERAGWDPASVDLVLLATSTPDDLFGSAPQVQALVGATGAVAFDLTAACSGFLFGLVTASQYLRCGAAQREIGRAHV